MKVLYLILCLLIVVSCKSQPQIDLSPDEKLKIEQYCQGDDAKKFTRHAKGGGLIGPNAKVDPSAFVKTTVIVCQKAQVLYRVKLSGTVVVYGEAQISGYVSVYDNAQVYGNAKLRGTVEVYGNAKIYGNANVGPDSEDYVIDRSGMRVNGDAEVYGDAIIRDGSYIGGTAKIYGKAKIQNQKITSGQIYE